MNKQDTLMWYIKEMQRYRARAHEAEARLTELVEDEIAKLHRDSDYRKIRIRSSTLTEARSDQTPRIPFP